MNILVLKLITGEEVLGEVVNKDPSFVALKNVVGIAVVRGQDGQPSIGFSPFPLHAEQKTGQTIAFSKKNVVYCYVPAEDFINNYNQIFGSGIVLPNKQLIVG